MENLEKAVKSFRKTMIIIAVFSFFATLLQLTIPLYMLQIYDRVLPSQSTDTLIFLSILAAFALITLGLTEMVRQIFATRASARLDAYLADDILEKVIRGGHDSNGNTQPMRDLAAVRSLVSSKILTGVIDLPFASIFVLCLYFIHPNLFWLLVIGTVVLAVIAIINQIMSKKSAEAQTQAANAANSYTSFFARNSDSIIAMGMLRDVVASWGNWNADTLIHADKASKINAFFSGISNIIRFGIQAGMLGLGAYLVQQGEMTAGMIFAASIISGRALMPIHVVINSWPQLNSGKSAWKNLKEYIGASSSREKYTEQPEPKGELIAENILQPNPVDRRKPPILNRVSFGMKPGDSVAVIGPSGSGKSTLARIVVGAFKPFSGDVKLDGNNITNWDPQDLGKHIGYLAQDVELLPGSIAQNISRFRPNVTDEEIRKAAELAHVDDLIKNMPMGYDTLIGPGGLSISGGEKQRIALARAFFGDPKLLVLDEPNSSLDRLGEGALLRALVAAKKSGITVFLVTQRESVIQVVDKIMRIKAGQIVDYGPRDKVIQKVKEAVDKSAKVNA